MNSARLLTPAEAEPAQRRVAGALAARGLRAGDRGAFLLPSSPELLVELLGGPEAELAPVPLSRPMHYTSGTTGRPKGVWSGVLSEADGAALLGEEAAIWGFGPGDVHLVCSPLHHSVAIRFGAGTLLAGGSVVVLPRFDARAAAAAIAEYRPTTAFM